MPPYRPLQERFNEKYLPEPMSGCWIWTGGTRSSGSTAKKRAETKYGCMLMPRSRECEAAHRISWMLHKGEIPPEMHVLHTCDVTLCVNPDHLFLGTHADNMRDCVAKGRKIMPSGEKHWRHRQ